MCLSLCTVGIIIFLEQFEMTSAQCKRNKILQIDVNKNINASTISHCYCILKFTSRMYLEHHIWSPASIPTLGPTWYSHCKRIIISIEVN